MLIVWEVGDQAWRVRQRGSDEWLGVMGVGRQEVPGVKKVVVNDLEEAAVEQARKNVEFNEVGREGGRKGGGAAVVGGGRRWSSCCAS